MRPLLASLRIANAPSVVSNTTFGVLLGGWYWGFGLHERFTTGEVLVIAAAVGLLLLFAGNLLNDWHDRDWDAEHRPERALPMGRYSPKLYLVISVALLVAASVAAAFLGTASLVLALAIAGCIVLYTVFHKRHGWAVLPMAACRAGLYGFGFLYFSPLGPDEIDYALTGGGFLGNLEPRTRAIGFAIAPMIGLFSYLVGLSLNARYESLERSPPGMVLIARVLLFLPLATHSCWWIPWYPKIGALALIPFALWLGVALLFYRKPLPAFVSALLAGIPLIDFIGIAPAVATVLGPDQLISDDPKALIGFVVPLGAFALARLLQKVAPAT
ncbi:UbiA family prenyltransferase [Haloferula sargassicola]|uniref:Protoheme IX farnesyltransferase n=1 Tax=Haloferula sargassicola TaxID=490096 RepID=A0ABP9UNJ7_9BACT